MSSNWRQKAACRPGQGVNSELFFPVGNTGPALLQAEEAIQVCRSCPAVAPCLEFALATKADGVWGAMTSDERDSLKRRRQRAAARVAADATA